MSIPLVQEATKDAINTSIIAIKRNIERINMLLGLSNSEEIDTSKFATKDELQQAVTELQPVDEVAANNMQSVTSNAVAAAINDTMKIQSFTQNINIQPNDDTNISFNLSPVSGYTPIFLTSIQPSVNNNNAVTVQGFWFGNDTATISIGNRGSIVLSGSLTIKIGYIKNIFI